jgi:hypothetical protein
MTAAAVIPTTAVEEEEVLVVVEAEGVVAEVEEAGAVATTITIQTLAVTTVEGILRNKRNSHSPFPNNKTNLPPKTFSLQYKRRTTQQTGVRVRLMIKLIKLKTFSDGAFVGFVVMKLFLLESIDVGCLATM